MSALASAKVWDPLPQLLYCIVYAGTSVCCCSVTAGILLAGCKTVCCCGWQRRGCDYHYYCFAKRRALPNPPQHWPASQLGSCNAWLLLTLAMHAALSTSVLMDCRLQPPALRTGIQAVAAQCCCCGCCSADNARCLEISCLHRASLAAPCFEHHRLPS